MNTICPICLEKQWSIFDQKYLGLFGKCWSCDKKDWEQGKLSLKEFDKRELEASKE
jgi:hypothetical protein